MNTPTTSHVAAFASARLVTAVMLAGVNTLASSQPTAAQIAHASAVSAKA
jgi:hypothetical protein